MITNVITLRFKGNAFTVEEAAIRHTLSTHCESAEITTPEADSTNDEKWSGCKISAKSTTTGQLWLKKKSSKGIDSSIMMLQGVRAMRAQFIGVHYGCNFVPK